MVVSTSLVDPILLMVRLHKYGHMQQVILHTTDHVWLILSTQVMNLTQLQLRLILWWHWLQMQLVILVTLQTALALCLRSGLLNIRLILQLEMWLLHMILLLLSGIKLVLKLLLLLILLLTSISIRLKRQQTTTRISCLLSLGQLDHLLTQIPTTRQVLVKDHSLPLIPCLIWWHTLLVVD